MVYYSLGVPPTGPVSHPNGPNLTWQGCPNNTSRASRGQQRAEVSLHCILTENESIPIPPHSPMLTLCSPHHSMQHSSATSQLARPPVSTPRRGRSLSCLYPPFPAPSAAQKSGSCHPAKGHCALLFSQSPEALLTRPLSTLLRFSCISDTLTLIPCHHRWPLRKILWQTAVRQEYFLGKIPNIPAYHQLQ